MGALGTTATNCISRSKSLDVPHFRQPAYLGTPGTMGAFGTTAAHCMSRSSSLGARSLKVAASAERHSPSAALTVLGTWGGGDSGEVRVDGR